MTPGNETATRIPFSADGAFLFSQCQAGMTNIFPSKNLSFFISGENEEENRRNVIVCSSSSFSFPGLDRSMQGGGWKQ